ncbi:MAG: HAD-IIB family hydrolase [Acidobacteria bacterium]|nr:HAD-IIB family hydrolase [Acidobacteriota bacterium]
MSSAGLDFVHFLRSQEFERVVAENGALLYQPASREVKLLGERPPEEFVARLRERNVEPLSVGRVIVATWHPHETTMLEVIRELGLELQVIFNKGAVMVLPSGVNKATGLMSALTELGLSPHNIVGIGDAENDHAFLSLCECSVAVANALPMLKDRADFVTTGDHGSGVIELIDMLVDSDLQELEPRLTRHDILLGTRENGQEARLKPYSLSVLIAGTSGGGKSTLATGFLERLSEQGYQFCIIDPEGDYSTFEGPVVVDVIIAVGESPEQTIRHFSETLGQPPPRPASWNLELGEAIGWWRRTGADPFWFRSVPPRAERRRHRRKYAEGELAPEQSFYFRGPNGKLNLRAQNLSLFMQLAEGVDDDTWSYHLHRGEYSKWFREVIKDEDLAAEAARIERLPDVSPEESRHLMREAIQKRYTAPA